MTRIPMDAGTACCTNRLGIDLVPNRALFSEERRGLAKKRGLYKFNQKAAHYRINYSLKSSEEKK